VFAKSLIGGTRGGLIPQAAPVVASTAPPYSTSFYERIAKKSRQSARAVVPVLVDLFRPSSVVDVGCGTGLWLAVFRALGVDVTGYEGPWIRSAHLAVAKDVIIEHDVTNRISSPRTFDLVLSLETAEHLPKSAAAGFVKSLVDLGSVVVFSAAVPRQGGTDHTNEAWPSVWVELFAHHDYVAIDCLRPLFWANDAVSWWYAQNMLLFVRRDHLPRYEHLAQKPLSAIGTALPLIHPRNYLALHSALDEARRQADLSQRSCSELIVALPAAARRALTTRLSRVRRPPSK
jgi:SAM-dependent methyltransferase